MLTSAAGAANLRAGGIAARVSELIVGPLEEPEALRRAHTRLFAQCGVRYLDCEGGQTVLRALRCAAILDEVFVTETDVVVDGSQHAGVLKIFPFEQEGAELIARDAPTTPAPGVPPLAVQPPLTPPPGGTPIAELNVVRRHARQSKLTISTQLAPLPAGYFCSSLSAPLAGSIA